MEKRNLELDLPVSADAWQVLVRTADELGPEQGFRAIGDEPRDIALLVTPETAPAGWQEWVSDRETYGEPERPAARLDFNDGDPYASVEPWAEPDEPAILRPQVDALQDELEAWVRDRWHELLQESGLHYAEGPTPR